MKDKALTDGKKQKGRRDGGDDQRNSSHSHRGMGEAEGKGQSDGHDQDGSVQGYSPGENLFGRIESLVEGEDFDSGKVLEAVRLIKKAHLDYVGAHKQRLETRLNEAKENENEFVKSCELLERKIEGFIETEPTD